MKWRKKGLIRKTVVASPLLCLFSLSQSGIPINDPLQLFILMDTTPPQLIVCMTINHLNYQNGWNDLLQYIFLWIRNTNTSCSNKGHRVNLDKGWTIFMEFSWCHIFYTSLLLQIIISIEEKEREPPIRVETFLAFVYSVSWTELQSKLAPHIWHAHVN